MRAVPLLPWLLVSAAPLAAQQSYAAGLLTAARAQVQTRHLDSAAILLRHAVDTAARGSRSERVEAWVLLGVVHFFSGDDSATASAFRQALALDRHLEAAGLERMDPDLARMLAAERAHLPPDTAAAAAGDAVHYCVGHCRSGELKPRLHDMPSLTDLNRIPMGAPQTRALILVQLVVSANGDPEPETIRIVSSNLRAVDAQVLQIVQSAHFTPATAASEPVRAQVQLRFEFHAEGFNAISYRVSGP